VLPVGQPDAAGQVRRMRIAVASHAEDEPQARYQFLKKEHAL